MRSDSGPVGPRPARGTTPGGRPTPRSSTDDRGRDPDPARGARKVFAERGRGLGKRHTAWCCTGIWTQSGLKALYFQVNTRISSLDIEQGPQRMIERVRI